MLSPIDPGSTPLAAATQAAESDALTAAGDVRGRAPRQPRVHRRCSRPTGRSSADPVATAAIEAFNEPPGGAPGRAAMNLLDDAQQGDELDRLLEAMYAVPSVAPTSPPRPPSRPSAARRRRSSAAQSGSTSPPTAAPAAAAAEGDSDAQHRDPRGGRRVRPGPPRGAGRGRLSRGAEAPRRGPGAQALMADLRERQQAVIARPAGGR